MISGKIKADLTNTRYKVIKECALELGWKVINHNENKAKQSVIEEIKKKGDISKGWEEVPKKPPGQMVDLYWNDIAIDPQKLTSMKRFQRVNHFPAMSGITRKATLANLLLKMQGLYPTDYNFFPKSWNVPFQMMRLKTEIAENKRKAYKAGKPVPMYIVKPSD